VLRESVFKVNDGGVAQASDRVDGGVEPADVASDRLHFVKVRSVLSWHGGDTLTATAPRKSVWYATGRRRCADVRSVVFVTAEVIMIMVVVVVVVGGGGDGWSWWSWSWSWWRQ
jgi:hypothetical protein